MKQRFIACKCGVTTMSKKQLGLHISRMHRVKDPGEHGDAGVDKRVNPTHTRRRRIDSRLTAVS